MEITEQKQLASTLFGYVCSLKGVTNYGLFGGAVRDWEHSREACDLDIFIEGSSRSISHDDICNYLDCAPKYVEKVHEVGQNKYTDSSTYKVTKMYEYCIFGQSVQFIFIEFKDPFCSFHEEVLKGFGVGISRGYYDQDFNKVISDEMNKDISNKTITIYPKKLGPNQSLRLLQHYLPKIAAKFPDHRILLDGAGEAE